MTLLQNVGLSQLTLPDGKTVAPGGTFDPTGVPDAQLRAWTTGGSVRPAPPKPVAVKRPKPTGDEQ